jgi:hypothetical protein
MADYKAKAMDTMEATVQKPSDSWCPAPHFAAKMECISPEGVRWTDGYDHNVVVTQGRRWLLNRIFNSATASTAGCFLQLHSATTAAAHDYAAMSASRVTAYGANIPPISMTATTNDTAQTMSASYAFTNGTQTVLGAAVFFYTSASMGTNPTAGDVLLYSEGQFGTTRTVGNGDTLNVTLTVAYA